MKLDKLLWSKTKVDILKYLIFCKEGISLRALENKLWWSFPSIKKQIDLLEKSWVIYVDKSWNSWAVYLKQDFKRLLSKLFLYSLQEDIQLIFQKNNDLVKDYYLGELFWFSIKADLFIIYQTEFKPKLDKLKLELDEVFNNYFILNPIVGFMSISEYLQRERIWDRFVIFLKSKGWKSCL